MPLWEGSTPQFIANPGAGPILGPRPDGAFGGLTQGPPQAPGAMPMPRAGEASASWPVPAVAGVGSAPIGFYWPRDRKHSFYNVGLALESALTARGVDLRPTPGPPRLAIKQPFFDYGFIENGMIEAYGRAPIRVAMEVADTTKLAELGCAALDAACAQVWFPSRFSCDAAAAGGLSRDKIRLIPHGIQAPMGSDYLHAMTPEIEALRADTRVKLGYSYTNSPQRKGFDLVVGAFAKLAKATKNAVLVIKYQKHAETQVFSNLAEAGLRDSPQVILMPGYMATATVSNWYRSLDAFLYPTRGGAFELIPLEAIACGVPTIVTGWGAPLDYATPRNALLIKTVGLTRATEAQRETTYRMHVGDCCEPDAAHLLELMQQVCDMRGTLRDALPDVGEPTARLWTWDAAAAKAIAALRELAPIDAA